MRTVATRRAGTTATRLERTDKRDALLRAAIDTFAARGFFNAQVADVARAVERVHKQQPRPLLEVSGGVTLATAPALAATGVDILSVGALTHSARAVDLSLELQLAGGNG